MEHNVVIGALKASSKLIENLHCFHCSRDVLDDLRAAYVTYTALASVTVMIFSYPF